MTLVQEKTNAINVGASAQHDVVLLLGDPQYWQGADRIAVYQWENLDFSMKLQYDEMDEVQEKLTGTIDDIEAGVVQLSEKTSSANDLGAVTQSQLALGTRRGAAALSKGRELIADRNPVAWRWLCKAADLGNADAQLELAFWHREDINLPKEPPAFRQHFPRDNRLAYMRYMLAEKQERWGAEDGKKHMATILSPAKVQEALKMAQEWQPGQCPQGPQPLNN